MSSKDELRLALHDASEIEHQLMLLYLYAAFSLKKVPDETCNRAQLEAVRRWGSHLYMVSRQEMEHLALVQNLLLGVGEKPFFYRPNLPVVSHYFKADSLTSKGTENMRPVTLPYQLSGFNFQTLQRFVCYESPGYQAFADSPEELPCWCFQSEGDEMPAHAAQSHDHPISPSHLGEDRLEGIDPSREAAAGLIVVLYEHVEAILERHPEFFLATPAGVGAIPSQYNIYLFPVTGVSSAKAAIDLILKQGEGAHAQPFYQSHFSQYMDMLKEYQELLDQDPSFEPAYPVLDNPKEELIEVDFTRESFRLFNDIYALVTLQLTAFYRHYVAAGQDAYPHFSAAMEQTVFGPMMTMFIRSMGEVMVQLPVREGENIRCGGNFDLTDDDQHLLRDPDSPDLYDIRFFLQRLEAIRDQLQSLSTRVPSHLATASPETIGKRLEYMYHNAYRLSLNLQDIYQTGKYAKF